MLHLSIACTYSNLSHRWAFNLLPCLLLQGETTQQAVEVPPTTQNNGAPLLWMQQPQEGAQVASPTSPVADDVTVQVALLTAQAVVCWHGPQPSPNADLGWL